MSRNLPEPTDFESLPPPPRSARPPSGLDDMPSRFDFGDRPPSSFSDRTSPSHWDYVPPRDVDSSYDYSEDDFYSESQDNIVERVARRFGNHYKDLKDGALEHGPGRGRRLVKAMAHTILPPLITISTIVGIGAYRSEDAVSAHTEPRIENVAQEVPATTPETTVPKSPLEQKYEESKVEVQNHPFTVHELIPEAARTRMAELKKQQNESTISYSEHDKLSPQERATRKQAWDKAEDEIQKIKAEYDDEVRAQKDESIIAAEREAHEAEFKMAVKLSSGMHVNIYGSGQDDKNEPLEIDPKALDIMVSELIRQAGTVETNPAADQIAELQAKAARSELKIKVDLIIVSDEKLCISNKSQSVSVFIPIVESSLIRSDQETATTRCAAVGVDLRTTKPGKSSLNHFVMVVDNGPGGSRGYYDEAAKTKGVILPPDQSAAVSAAHEISHVLFGSTDANGTIDADQEHEKFVFPLESKMYNYYCDLKKQNSNNMKLATPFHVDDPAPNSTSDGVRIVTSEEEFNKAVEDAKKNGTSSTTNSSTT